MLKKIFALFSIFYFLFSITFAASPVELKDSINQKTEELQKITSQIKDTQKKIEDVKTEGKTLKKEITGVDTQLSQISLNIKASEILIDRLKLETESVSYDIEDIENKINSQREAIVSTLIELQKKEDETPLTIFLKNKNLAESILEAQSLNNLSLTLTNEVGEMKILKSDMEQKKYELSDKKIAKENEAVNLKNKKLISEDIKKEKQTILEKTKNQEKIYQSQLTELEKKQLEISSEIEKIEEELRLKIDPSLLPASRPGVLGKPTSGTPLTQEYGATSFALRGGYKGKWHNGIDYGGPIGTPVYAAEVGTIIGIDNQDKYCYRGAYGKYIVIEHENNLTTLYAHLSLQTVKKGDIVKRGDLIGYIGKTGYATGPHLHFTVYSSATFIFKQSKSCGIMPFGGDLNPLQYL